MTNALMVFTLRIDLLGAVIVVINLRIRKRFLVIHFAAVQHLFDGGPTNADGKLVIRCCCRQTLARTLLISINRLVALPGCRLIKTA